MNIWYACFIIMLVVGMLVWEEIKDRKRERELEQWYGIKPEDRERKY